jgi:hypothetical protein
LQTVFEFAFLYYLCYCCWHSEHWICDAVSLRSASLLFGGMVSCGME